MTEFQEGRPKAVAVLVVGMAGAGKTTLMHRLNLHMVEQNLRGLEKAIHFTYLPHLQTSKNKVSSFLSLLFPKLLL